MTTFMILWNAWAHIFRALPYGDPYIASFALIAIGVMTIKVMFRASRYVAY